jgi:hypothetical protein
MRDDADAVQLETMLCALADKLQERADESVEVVMSLLWRGK